MKVGIVSVGALLLVASAHAGPVNELTLTPGETLFQKVSDLYASGSAPGMENYVNREASGRCFTANEPNRPLAVYFVATTNNDAGPLGASVVSFIMHYDPNKAPGYYDAMTKDQIFQEINWNPSDFISLAAVDGNTLSGTYQGGDEARFRQSGTYLVSQLHEKSDNDTLFCYFFKLN